MAKKPVIAWSFSLIEAFELCPKKVYHERIAKDIKQQRSSVGDYGFEAHKHFENRLLKGTPLPLDLKHHEKILAKLEKISGQKLPEQKLAINMDFQPTGFFDNDVYGRGVIDFGILDSSKMLVADWKFGKQKEGFDQIELMIAIMSCYEPDIERYEGIYYWAKSKNITRKTVNKAQIPAIWNKFMPRIEKLEQAYKNDEFPAKENFLCRKYCPVKQCKFNGG